MSCCTPDPGTARYDLDVFEEIRTQYPDIMAKTIGPGGDIAFDGTGDVALDAALYVLPAQVLAAQWSEALNLNVDDPFHGQNLTRVVSGVTLYPWQS